MTWNYKPKPSEIMIRCASHRARKKLFRLRAEPFESYFSFETFSTGGFYPVPIELVSQALAITSCSRASHRFTYHPSIKWS